MGSFNPETGSPLTRLISRADVDYYNGFLVRMGEYCTVLGSLSKSPVLEIPREINGKEVKVIGTGDRELPFTVYAEEVILPDTVTTIQPGAFYGCDTLKSVDGCGVTNVGAYAFYMSAIEEFSTSSSVLIDSSAFTLCERLQKISIENVTYIGDYAFSYCAELKELFVGNRLHYVGDYAFYKCRNLEKVVIHSSLEELCDYVFSDCYGLSDVLLERRTISIPDTTFKECHNLKSIKYVR